MNLETERLLLRELTRDEVQNLLQIYADLAAMKHDPSTKTVPETLQWIERNLDGYREHGHGLWTVIGKDDGAFLGAFLGQWGLLHQNVRGRNETELGYSFVRRFRGNGYAAEAARACRDYGLGQLCKDRLVSFIDLDNQPSIRLRRGSGWCSSAALVLSERGHGLLDLRYNGSLDGGVPTMSLFRSHR